MANSKSMGVAFEDPAIVGGAVDNTPVGATTASTGAFTTLTASGATTLNGNVAVGNAATDLVGFHGATAVDQAAVMTSVAATDVTQVSAFGWSTSAKAWAATTAIDAIIAALKEKGLVALA